MGKSLSKGDSGKESRPVSSETEGGELRRLFSLCDRDGSGGISKEELTTMLNFGGMKVLLNPKITKFTFRILDPI